MPNLIYNIPTDQSSFLTRSTYAANPSVYAAFYATVLGATSSSDVKKIKYVVHVVDSKGMAISNSNIEFSMAKVKETLLLIGVKLEPVAVDLADAPLDNAYGIVRVKDTDIPPQIRVDGATSHMYTYKHGVTYFERNRNNGHISGITLSHLQNLLSWDTSKYLNIYFINNLLGLDMDGVNSVPSPFNALNPLAASIAGNLNNFGVTVPYWSTPGNAWTGDGEVDYTKANLPDLEVLYSNWSSTTEDAVFDALFKGIYTSLGITGRAEVLSTPTASAFSEYLVDQCPTDGECFYTHGQGSCVPFSFLLPITLGDALDSAPSTSSCDSHVYMEHLTGMDLPRSLNPSLAVGMTTIHGVGGLTGLSSFIKNSFYVDINTGVPFILKELDAFATFVEEVEPIEPVDPTIDLTVLDCAALGDTIVFETLPTDWQAYLLSLLPETEIIETRVSEFEGLLATLNNLTTL